MIEFMVSTPNGLVLFMGWVATFLCMVRLWVLHRDVCNYRDDHPQSQNSKLMDVKINKRKRAVVFSAILMGSVAGYELCQPQMGQMMEGLGFWQPFALYGVFFGFGYFLLLVWKLFAVKTFGIGGTSFEFMDEETIEFLSVQLAIQTQFKECFFGMPFLVRTLKSEQKSEEDTVLAVVTKYLAIVEPNLTVVVVNTANLPMNNGNALTVTENGYTDFEDASGNFYKFILTKHGSTRCYRLSGDYGIMESKELTDTVLLLIRYATIEY